VKDSDYPRPVPHALRSCRDRDEHTEGYLATPFNGNSGRRKDMTRMGWLADTPVVRREMRFAFGFVARPTAMMHPR
jgi:hypothetical protein